MATDNPNRIPSAVIDEFNVHHDRALFDSITGYARVGRVVTVAERDGYYTASFCAFLIGVVVGVVAVRLMGWLGLTF